MIKRDNFMSVLLIIILISLSVLLINSNTYTSETSIVELEYKNETNSFKCYNYSISIYNFWISQRDKNLSFSYEINEYESSLLYIYKIQEQLPQLNRLLKNEEIQKYLHNYRFFYLFVVKIVREINNALVILKERLGIDLISLYLNQYLTLSSKREYQLIEKIIKNCRKVIFQYKEVLDKIYLKMYSLKLEIENELKLTFQYTFIDISLFTILFITLISLQIYMCQIQSNIIISFSLTIIICLIVLIISQENQRKTNDLEILESEIKTIVNLKWNYLKMLMEKYDKFECFYKNFVN